MPKAADIEVEDQVDGADDDAIVEDEQDDAANDDDKPDEGDESQDDGTEGESDDEGDDEGDDDGVVVSIGEESPPSDEDQNRAPEWVRELRKSNREKDRRIRELESQVASRTPGQQPVAVGEKPTLEGCNFDTEKFERDLEAWHARKSEADAQARTRTQAEELQRAHWQTRIDAVAKAGSSLKVKDYDDAAQVFEDQFSAVQQGIVIGGPDDPKTSALLRYALGRNPKKAKDLASITDPVKFAFAVAKLETQLKVTPRKAAPAPDRTLRSSVAGAAAVDNQLARLRQEAEKTGDYSKVHAYRQNQRAKERGK